MTKQNLIARLRRLSLDFFDDPVMAHIRADELLLEYIDDEDITAAFENLDKWYS